MKETEMNKLLCIANKFGQSYDLDNKTYNQFRESKIPCFYILKRMIMLSIMCHLVYAPELVIFKIMQDCT